MSTQLSTNWNAMSIGMCQGAAADVVNTIIMPVDGIKAKRSSIGATKTNKRINRELERRGIDYRISKCYSITGLHLLTNIWMIPVFVEMHQIAVALNLLSEDYNSRGC